ncbi:MAG: 2-isopropylmalate synthase [Epulopiscium sp. Nele67-Bin004]|nr:MAG: 2-isopropylmalate synthase [Epulopiscium sp. Nele67-Bin004]
MQIKIFDTTLRDGEQAPGYSMNLSEKLEMALQLEKLGVDIIEAGFAIASPGDFKAVSEIAKIVKNTTVASLSRALVKDIDVAAQAVQGANFPRIHTFIATSDIHMKYKLKKSEDEVLEITREMVKHAKKYCSDIEFSAEDASRSRPEFLYRVLEQAILSGATVLNIPDTVGYSSPLEYHKLILGIKENVRGIEKVDISVHCHNDLGLAVANTLAAISAGATQVECTVNGIGERAGNAALEEIVMNLNTRKDIYPYTTNVNTREIYLTSKLLTTITGVKVQPNKAIVGENAFAHESGIHQHGMLENKETYEIMTPASIGLSENKIVLGKHSGRHAFVDRLNELGYVLSEEEIDESFVSFKALADKKKTITDRDIQALVLRQSIKVPDVYTLDRFVINAGNTITITSAVRLRCENGDILEEVTSSFDGPIDASYKAINAMLGKDFVLEDFLISSVTGGTDSQGEVYVKIKNKQGSIYNGYGVSIDIVEASILAYISAINNMIHDEMS